jgi:hypothetical protein
VLADQSGTVHLDLRAVLAEVLEDAPELDRVA